MACGGCRKKRFAAQQKLEAERKRKQALKNAVDLKTKSIQKKISKG
jgi:hypothetical protein